MRKKPRRFTSAISGAWAPEPSASPVQLVPPKAPKLPINLRVFYQHNVYQPVYRRKVAPFTRAWLNLFTLTFRALGRNHIASTSAITIAMLCFN